MSHSNTTHTWTTFFFCFNEVGRAAELPQRLIESREISLVMCAWMKARSILSSAIGPVRKNEEVFTFRILYKA